MGKAHQTLLTWPVSESNHAAGSGTTVQDVNALIRQFEQAKGMMKQMMNARGKRGRMRLPF